MSYKVYNEAIQHKSRVQIASAPVMHVPKGRGLFRELVKSIIRPIRVRPATAAHAHRHRMHYFCYPSLTDISRY